MRKLIERLEEQGRGMGPGGRGLGPGGKCKCPKCGYESEHSTGEACMDKACPKCGTKMVREDLEESKFRPSFTKQWLGTVITMLKNAKDMADVDEMRAKAGAIASIGQLAAMLSKMKDPRYKKAARQIQTAIDSIYEE